MATAGSLEKPSAFVSSDVPQVLCKDKGMEVGVPSGFVSPDVPYVLESDKETERDLESRKIEESLEARNKWLTVEQNQEDHLT